MTPENLPECWRTALADEFVKPYFHDLQSFMSRERKDYAVFPPATDVFAAFQLTPLKGVRVVILGQDPYHDDNQAHGLSFSVRAEEKIPPSLRNIYRELQTDLDLNPPPHGCLESWARQGVLLLNTVLTVRAHAANSHRKQGWETFTNRVIECVNARPAVVFILWGKPAQAKEALIDPRHLVLKSAHPSPLSARRGFFNSQPFSKTNAFLVEDGQRPIDWRIPDAPAPHARSPV